MDVTTLLLILIVGMGAGFMNILAGGGSLLTLPLLIFLGLPAALANGTNRVAIVVQNLVALRSFHKKGLLLWKQGWLYGIPATIGTIIGSLLAVEIPESWFNRILSIVMVVILGTLFIKPKNGHSPAPMTMTKKVLMALAFILIGLYGGFIQAGVGFIIVSLLRFTSSIDLVKINSLKVLIVTIYISFSLAIFIVKGQVHWGYGLTLAVGNSLGAALAAKAAIQKGEGVIKVVIVIAVIIMSLNLWFT
ncbi:hypothetical protein N781_03650 [Pontibacillus halophilus JSM 076056 = DSM 19796]|uniref:Probable membrane transporter protein n=1 Tax=Pontibacillus halophilus JSM 076056 = DSM 19796 TaxID=1385510 RepID=A0A0A5GHX5_9BACI|nr:sulfite exporter TauE/SafE family protein [Pontibacillus halophilus]KGX91594.1 hypothetical protein N781_03650 [Pontibacillus halophilus JSM 076056 = DSM 19796]